MLICIMLTVVHMFDAYHPNESNLPHPSYAHCVYKHMTDQPICNINTFIFKVVEMEGLYRIWTAHRL